MILVGDAGGTNVRFALARFEGGRIALSEIWKRPGTDYPSVSRRRSMRSLPETKPDVLRRPSFGFAGVVADGDTVELAQSRVDRRSLSAREAAAGR